MTSLPLLVSWFFYSAYIDHFEQRIAPLRALAKLEMEAVVTKLLTPAHADAKSDMINAFCSDPCIQRFSYDMTPYLLTDFSGLGFGYDLCQPDANHPASIAAMHCERAGGDCEFLLRGTKLRLRSTGFRSRAAEISPLPLGRSICFRLGDS